MPLLDDRLSVGSPVEAGFVTEPQHWKWSSAHDYMGGKQGMIDVIILV